MRLRLLRRFLVVILGWQEWAISEKNMFRTYFFENNHELAQNFFYITPGNSTFFNQHLAFPHAISTTPLEIPSNICNIPPISLGYVTHVFSYTRSVLLIDLLHIRYCIPTYLPTYQWFTSNVQNPHHSVHSLILLGV